MLSGAVACLTSVCATGRRGVARGRGTGHASGTCNRHGEATRGRVPFRSPVPATAPTAVSKHRPRPAQAAV
eukprot:3043468-Prymnesium_polylepis.1